MRSVADELREELGREARERPLAERLELAFRLGEEGLALFQAASGLSREEAIRELERRRQAGRTPSKCMAELIG
ncbi:MAG: hypothetical protein U0002_14350 [Thermoanaerobaculia bacterium]